MGSKRKIGDIVHPVDVRNNDLRCDNLLGLSMTKEFRPSTSNIVGTDLSKYKIVGFNEFAVDFMSAIRVHKMPIALNRTGKDIIVSPAYGVFAVNNEDEVLPEYLMLWFMRPDFDRYADFKSDSAIRGGYDWNELCDTDISLPSLPEQRKIVHDYKVITDRIELLRKMNENLEEQAYTLFQQAIGESEKDGVLSDLAIITMGTSPEGETMNNVGEGEVFYQGRTDFGFRFPTVRLYTTEAVRRAKCGDVLMSVRAPVGDINIAKEDCAIGRGLASIRPKDKCYSFMYYTMKALYFELQRFNDEGTVFGAITKDDLAGQKVAVLNNSERKAFDEKAKPIDACIRNNEYEIFTLQTLRNNILSGLAKGA